jgi:hypothetical protein
MALFNRAWLPTGHHWNLHTERHESLGAGGMTGGGQKLVWHTTESGWVAVDAMVGVLVVKAAAPHFVIGGRQGLEHPVVVQMLPLTTAGRALANNSGDGFQTNRANAIQVEICGRTSEIPQWGERTYKALANLSGLIMHRVNIPNVASHDFSSPRRLTDQEWVAAKGHVGHVHAPDNDHTDPTRLREGFLVDLISKLPRGGYEL